MCRFLSYLGKPQLIDQLLYEPDNSLIKQAHSPQLMHMIQNLAGFGLTSWNSQSEQPELPLCYRSIQLPFYDQNLMSLSTKMVTECLIAHVRGVNYTRDEIVIEKNLHPFLYENTTIAFAHNGALLHIDRLKWDIAKYIKKDVFNHIAGTTDTEWIYALYLSQLDDYAGPITLDDAIEALYSTLDILNTIRKDHNINVVSPLNLVISNGDFLIATRFVFNYGHFPPAINQAHFAYHSLWYSLGEEYGMHDGNMGMSKGKQSVIISSEPLTKDKVSWIEVPEYSFVTARHVANELDLKIYDLRV